MSRGGGIVGIHADANADRDWAWKGDMMGDAWFANHPAGALQFQDATVVNEDPTHPAMAGIGATWVRNDEWYNFTAEPRGKVHVLATLDENTYDEQDGSAAADDHPIAWCSNYDGGRHFYTALGHNGSAWQEPLYRSHILGAIQWAAGVAEGDCGEEREGLPTDAAFDKVTLDDNTENPMEIAIAPDRKVYIVELGGRVKEYNPRDAVGPDDRHDPRPSRQRERPARHRARPGLRDQPPPLPLLQRADPRRSSGSPASRSPRTGPST